MMPHQNIVSLRLAKCVLSSPHQCIRIRHLIIFQLSIGWNLDPLHFWPNKAVMCSTLWQLEMPCGHTTEMMYSLKTTQDSELRWDKKNTRNIQDKGNAGAPSHAWCFWHLERDLHLSSGNWNPSMDYTTCVVYTSLLLQVWLLLVRCLVSYL